MPKTDTRYVCQKCGQDYPAWAGQCQSCGEWNCLIEEIQNPKSKIQIKSQIQNSKPISITKVDYSKDTRQSTGIGEVDRVLGGGVDILHGSTDRYDGSRFG